MHLILKKKINFINFFFYKYYIYIVFVSLLFTTLLASLVFAYKFSLLFPEIISGNLIQLEKIPFNIGNLVNNLLNNSSYKIQKHGIDWYLDRLPFVAFTTILISKISTNIYIFLTIKNCFFFFIFFYICNKTKNLFNNNAYFFFILTHIIFINFYNFQTTLNFVFEDAYISILLPSLFLILINNKIKNKEIYISVLLVSLLFTKVTMIYVTIFVTILFTIFNKTKIIYRILPLFFLIAAMFFWGMFGYTKTKRIPFLNSMTSISHEGMAFVFNKNFKEIYPHKIIDILEPEVYKNLPQFKSEWEYDDYFKEKNLQFLKNNKLEILKGIQIKLNFLFFNIYDQDGTTRNLISHLLNRVVFLFSLFIFLLNIIKKKTQSDFYFITIIISVLIPYIAGWITSKHLVPIFIICQIYILLNIYRFIYRKI
jgi:hypothetical protein